MIAADGEADTEQWARGLVENLAHAPAGRGPRPDQGCGGKADGPRRLALILRCPATAYDTLYRKDSFSVLPGRVAVTRTLLRWQPGAIRLLEPLSRWVSLVRKRIAQLGPVCPCR